MTIYSIRKIVKKLAKPLGLDQLFRNLYVQSYLFGENLAFMAKGRPSPSTTIFLAGSGRSGTTWIQEALSSLPGVQPIFEPFHPLFNEKVRELTGFNRDDPFFRAWYLPAGEEFPEWSSHMEDVLTGRIRSWLLSRIGAMRSG